MPLEVKWWSTAGRDRDHIPFLPLTVFISEISKFRSRLGRRNEAPSVLLSCFWPLGTENVEVKGSSPG